MMKKTIISISPDEPRLKVKLGTGGCDGSQVVTNASLYVTWKEKRECLQTKWSLCGEPAQWSFCNGVPQCDEQIPMHTPHDYMHGYRYDSIGVDADGLTEFYLDDKIISKGISRYNAYITVGGKSVMEFDIVMDGQIHVESIQGVRTIC